MNRTSILKARSHISEISVKKENDLRSSGNLQTIDIGRSCSRKSGY